jgi:hypothetical protein
MSSYFWAGLKSETTTKVVSKNNLFILSGFINYRFNGFEHENGNLWSASILSIRFKSIEKDIISLCPFLIPWFSLFSANNFQM